MSERVTTEQAREWAAKRADDAGRCACDLLEARTEIERLRKTFGHYHVAGTTKGLDIDTCAQCGMDIRNEIHWRSTAPLTERPR